MQVTRCPLERLSDLRNNLLAQGRWSLVLDLIPRYWSSRRQNSALLNKARERGGAWDIAVLLGVSFPGGQQGARQIFDCDEEDAVSRKRAVHFAAELGDEALLEVLISARANLNAQDRRGRTPLILAAMKGYHKVVRALMSNGANPALTDRDGNTVLDLTKTAATFECLRSAGAQMPDITDENKDALLLRYARNGAVPLLRAVLQAGATLAHTDQVRMRACVISGGWFVSE